LFGLSPENSLGDIDSSSQEDCPQPAVQDRAACRARLVAPLADSLIRDLESEENEIARIVAGKILDEVLPPPKREYTLKEPLAELDRDWAQSHGC
jgi:hypothetical protein